MCRTYKRVESNKKDANGREQNFLERSRVAWQKPPEEELHETVAQEEETWKKNSVSNRKAESLQNP